MALIVFFQLSGLFVTKKIRFSQISMTFVSAYFFPTLCNP